MLYALELHKIEYLAVGSRPIRTKASTRLLDSSMRGRKRPSDNMRLA